VTGANWELRVLLGHRVLDSLTPTTWSFFTKI